MAKTENAARSYLKYSGIAFQLAAIVFIAYWVGGKIDKWLNLPYIATFVLILTVFSLYIYKLYVELFPPKRK